MLVCVQYLGHRGARTWDIAAALSAFNIPSIFVITISEYIPFVATSQYAKSDPLTPDTGNVNLLLHLGFHAPTNEPDGSFIPFSKSQ